MANQRIEDGQLMIDASSEETDAQHKRGLNVAQRLVEIGAVLFTNRKQNILRQIRSILWLQRIEISDNGPGFVPFGNHRTGATVGRNKARCDRKCLRNVLRGQISAAN